MYAPAPTLMPVAAGTITGAVATTATTAAVADSVDETTKRVALSGRGWYAAYPVVVEVTGPTPRLQNNVAPGRYRGAVLSGG